MLNLCSILTKKREGRDGKCVVVCLSVEIKVFFFYFSKWRLEMNENPVFNPKLIYFKEGKILELIIE